MSQFSSIRAIAAAVFLIIAAAAHANPVLVQNAFANAATEATGATAGGPNTGTFRVGEFTGTVDGATFLSYCIDLAQHFSFGSAYTNYVAGSGVSALGATRATQIGELLTAAGGFALSTASKSRGATPASLNPRARPAACPALPCPPWRCAPSTTGSRIASACTPKRSI